MSMVKSKALISGATTKNQIYVIGPQAAGKTTYLLALGLIYYSQHKSHQKKVAVTPISSPGQAEELVQEGKLKWRSSTPLLPTDLPSDFSQLPEYNFLITISNLLRLNTLKIRFTARDYSGEFFQDLLQYPPPSRLENYLNNCLNNPKGWILMLPDFVSDLNEQEVDNFYVEAIHKLISRANQGNVMQKLRIAVVMSKCERGEIWPSRWEPERDLFKIRLPKTTELLRNSSFISKAANISFFALSSFGVLNVKDSRPNRYIVGQGAVLSNTDQWLPYGLISPLYWIATGKKWKDPSF